MKFAGVSIILAVATLSVDAFSPSLRRSAVVKSSSALQVAADITGGETRKKTRAVRVNTQCNCEGCAVMCAGCAKERTTLLVVPGIPAQLWQPPFGPFSECLSHTHALYISLSLQQTGTSGSRE